MSNNPIIIRAPTATAEEKAFQQCRFRMLHHLKQRAITDPRSVELNLFMKANRNHLLYIEQCTAYNSGYLEEATLPSILLEEQDVSKMFAVQQTIATDSRNALSRCGQCKSTNVENIARQVRSADEGMSVFSTCLDCGHKWVQR